MFAEAVFVGYDENGIPMFKTVYDSEPPIYIGITYDEENRAVPLYA